MNALPSIQSPVIPEASSAAGAAAAPISATSGSGKSTFAGALQDAGTKPARKATSSKSADSAASGASLPVNGNVAPQPPVTVPPAIPVAAPGGDSPSPATAAGLAAVDGGSSAAKALPGAANGATESSSSSPAVGAAIPSAAAAAFATLLGESTADRVADAGPMPSSAAALDAAAATGGGGAPSLAGFAAPAVVAETAAAPVAVASAAVVAPVSGSPSPAAAPTTLVSKSQRPMIAGAPASHAGAQVKAASHASASADNDDDGSGVGESQPDRGTAAATTGGLAQAGTAASSEPGTLVAAAMAGSRPVSSAGADDSDDASASIADVAAPEAVGAAGAAATATLSAARAVMNGANAVTLQAAANDKHAQDGSGTPGAGSTDSALGLSQAGSAAVSGPDSAPSTPTFRIAANVDSSDFSQGIADRVSWMVSNDLNGAKLQVNPAQLGPIELRISVTGDHAQVWMSTHSAVTRDALEASSPKLREMLGAQGFGQVSVDISQRSFQDRSAYAQPYQAPVSKSVASTSVASISASATPRTSSGVLDAYA